MLSDTNSSVRSDEDILKEVIIGIKYTYDLFGGASNVTVWDTEKLLVYYEAPDMKLGLKANDKMSEKTSAYKCLSTKKRIVTEISKEKSAFNIAYVGMSIPIFNENRIIGVISITSPVMKQNLITEMAEHLQETALQTTKASEGIASSASDIAFAIEELQKSSQQAKNEIGTIGDVIDLIKQISDQTRLLSLNAAIESARAGEAGKGFGVVANEIKKLAQGTAGNVQEISRKLSLISNSVEAIAHKVAELDSLAQNQAAATEEINAAMNTLDGNAKRIIDIAKHLTD